MRAFLSITMSGALTVPTLAAEMNVSIEIPKLNVAEYHRPYVAIWLEKPDQSFVGNLAVWYDVKLKNNEGTKWLKDMRQWWRKSGRELDMPVDGLSSATRAPGEHKISVALDKLPVKDLAAGEYQLVVEAAREVGGRELLRVPFQWPAKTAQSLKFKGEHELGSIALDLKP
ncbi:DUF2271 domain-containing protein [Pseudorhodoplanes sinuspersici]|uniref:Uncharacterized protein n=1 Tax=Pseudorhodoplanes sinuspersici TaxID=1235591 RepID=A0A1W6ZUH1_9HYPH|nr:DUF2271 domain-containing protein [Pseudorhodoplanes sinuspersici]ARQ00982.1 hypothetical protein CAK95_19200 [Pseudorhodoplanes sinuspersici]RKE72619.1 hypothetical protein DFP91_0487 [Pseudorhodoplanes sinuspersici]